MRAIIGRIFNALEIVLVEAFDQCGAVFDICGLQTRDDSPCDSHPALVVPVQVEHGLNRGKQGACQGSARGIGLHQASILIVISVPFWIWGSCYFTADRRAFGAAETNHFAKRISFESPCI